MGRELPGSYVKAMLSEYYRNGRLSFTLRLVRVKGLVKA
jgi:hypothetical protein